MEYFEICMSLSPDGKETSNDSWMCIRGLREPTVEQAREFLKEDEQLFGGRVIGVFPIDKAEAQNFYDFSNEANWPVFTGITRDTRRPITEDIKAFAREFEWGEFEIEHGYGYFETQIFDYDDVIVMSRHIQAIGDMGVFDSDMDAALYAEKFYGEKIFHYDVVCGAGEQELQNMWFIDDPETRKAVEDYLVRMFGPDHGLKPDYETVALQERTITYPVTNDLSETIAAADARRVSGKELQEPDVSRDDRG